MANRRKPADTIPVLLSRVDEIINSTSRNSTGTEDKSNGSIPKLTKLRAELEKIEDLFPNFKHCEEAFTNKLNSLREEIFDDVFDYEIQTDEINININLKLERIFVKMEDIKKFVSKIQLPPPGEIASASQAQARAQARSQARQARKYWINDRVDRGIFESPALDYLQLGYDDLLDLPTKLCLLCFAVFPEKAVIKKRPLIYWWIGEDLIRKTTEKTAEEIGEGIFESLTKKSFVRACHKKSPKFPIVDSCTVHPWIHRMLVSEARRAAFFDIDRDYQITDDYSKSRRACLFLDNKGFSGNDVKEGDQLPTLFNVDEQYLSFKPGLFSKLRRLTILQLGRWHDSAKHHIEVDDEQFLEELHLQKYLKYLSLHGVSRITTLPSSIVECTNLEILDLRACHNLEILPNDISSLWKLTHLDVSECYLLEGMPKGIDKLYSLQVLKGFVVGHSMKNPCKLGDLAQLKKLRRLSVHFRSEAAAIEDGELEKLKDFETLVALTMSWGGVVTAPSKHIEPPKNDTNLSSSPNAKASSGPKLTKAATMIKESYLFPPKLKKLDLRCFPRRTPPKWLTAENLKGLKKLYIRGGELESLGTPAGDTKWEVEFLRLKYLKNLIVKVFRIREDFPFLTYLEKVKCHQISTTEYEADVEWTAEE